MNLLPLLNIFTKLNENYDEKLKFTFKLYDVDNDGYISNDDLFQVLKVMVGDNLNEKQLHQLVDRTIIKGDLDKDGKLNYEEFNVLVDKTNLVEKMALDNILELLYQDDNDDNNNDDDMDDDELMN